MAKNNATILFRFDTLTACPFAPIGAPQFGQVRAKSETCLPHSEHLTNIRITFFRLSPIHNNRTYNRETSFHARVEATPIGKNSACLVQDISNEAPLRARTEIPRTGTQNRHTYGKGMTCPGMQACATTFFASVRQFSGFSLEAKKCACAHLMMAAKLPIGASPPMSRIDHHP